MFILGKDFIVCRSLTTMRAVKDSLFSLLNLPDDGRLKRQLYIIQHVFQQGAKLQ